MNLNKLLVTTVFTAAAVFANDHLNEIAGTAKQLESDFGVIARTLKNKKFATDELKRDVEAARPHVDRLKAAADQFEAANPSLSERQKAEWSKTKELIALVDIFHSRKSELLDSGAAAKNRKLLEAKAKGLVHRSTMLRESAQKLSQGLGNS
mgnify:CR=1 FL=1